MATVITAHDGKEYAVTPKDKATGFSLSELYDLIGNNCDTVEHVRLADGRSILSACCNCWGLGWDATQKRVRAKIRERMGKP